MSFPRAYESVPKGVVCCYDSMGVKELSPLGVKDVTKNGFTVYMSRVNDIETRIRWISVG